MASAVCISRKVALYVIFKFPNWRWTINIDIRQLILMPTGRMSQPWPIQARDFKKDVPLRYMSVSSAAAMHTGSQFTLNDHDSSNGVFVGTSELQASFYLQYPEYE